MAWVVSCLSHTRGRRALEYKERIAILNLRDVFQLVAEREISDAEPLKGHPDFRRTFGVAKAMP